MSAHALNAPQRGFTITSQAIVAVIVVLLAILVMRIVPATIEYFSVQRIVKILAKDATTKGDSVEAIRAAFDKRATVDDVSAVAGGDLDISKEGGEVVIAFAYSKKIPLFGPVSLCFDFQGSTTPSGK